MKGNEMKKSQKVYAKGFKGFNPGMVCRGKQYKENTVFTEKIAEMCERGMHFCKNPLDVLTYYPLMNREGVLNEFAEVEALAPIKETEDKSVTTKLKIGKKLSLGEFIRAAVNYLFREKGSVEVASGDFSKLTASGDYSQLVASGVCPRLTASGEHSNLAASGDASKLVASGDCSQLVASGFGSWLVASGDDSKLAASGECSRLAVSGNCSQLVASGFGSQLAASGAFSRLAASGECSRLAASGDDSKLAATGPGSVVASVGANGRVKGGLGSFLACAEWRSDDEGKLKPVALLAGKVDNKTLKADTWYTVKGSKWVEVAEMNL